MVEQQAVWLVMGVSGSGKTSVAGALAEATGGVWLDADDYHPRRNIERMTQGQPLSDEDRWPWLAAVAEAASRARGAVQAPVFMACSALKASYRRLLRERLPGLHTLYLEGDETLIFDRMSRRDNHYMGAGMLHSQFLDLEPPQAEADVFVVDIRADRAAVVAEALRCVHEQRGAVTR
ncbi:MAG: gluconokinase [Hydrogenophaga sp.]|nr:gluconokinase [Hydrogenophaga sp.]